jgi:hypothetical protein
VQVEMVAQDHLLLVMEQMDQVQYLTQLHQLAAAAAERVMVQQMD